MSQNVSEWYNFCKKTDEYYFFSHKIVETNDCKFSFFSFALIIMTMTLYIDSNFFYCNMILSEMLFIYAVNEKKCFLKLQMKIEKFNEMLN